MSMDKRDEVWWVVFEREYAVARCRSVPSVSAEDALTDEERSALVVKCAREADSLAEAAAKAV